jgi:DNA-binding IclR family transcriptional regulator
MRTDTASPGQDADAQSTWTAPDASATTMRAVDRALGVLCAFSRETPALGVTELSERLNLTKSTVHRLLQVLLARGMVAREPEHRRYMLGYRIVALAQAVPGEATLRQISRPHMLELRSVTQETISLYVTAGDVRFCLEEFESPQMLRMGAGLGRCLPLGRGAAGKVLLIDTTEQDELWRRVTVDMPAVERAQLALALADIRAHGYCATSNETVEGAASIAAAIRDRRGHVVAALSIAGPDSRFKHEVREQFASLLLEAGERITHDLAIASSEQANGEVAR